MDGCTQLSCSRLPLKTIDLPARRLLNWGSLWALSLFSLPAHAAPRPVVALETRVTDQVDCSGAQTELKPAVHPERAALARHVDSLVADAIEDAGLELAVRSTVVEPTSAANGCLSELELLALAKKAWVVAPRVVVQNGKLLLRLVSGNPDSSVLRVATQELVDSELDVRVVVMVSELLAASKGKTNGRDASQPSIDSEPPSSTRLPPHKVRSPGRAVLTLTSGFLGGAVGYSLQRASNSNDPRLTYPLIALGTGIGAGAAFIAADEWDVSVAEAWYLNAGMLWPAASGLLLARAYQVTPATDRYVWGLGGAALGLTLSSFALSSSEISDGGALVTHSGGTAGLLMGGLVDMAISGTTTRFPWHGMGYGSGIGVLTAGAIATQINISSSRVLFVDMAAGLGALTGAAAGSPLLFVENEFISVSVKRQRAWLGVVGVGAIAGGAIGWYLTRKWPADERDGNSSTRYWPYATLAPATDASDAGRGTACSMGLQGQF